MFDLCSSLLSLFDVCSVTEGEPPTPNPLRLHFGFTCHSLISNLQERVEASSGGVNKQTT